jgi:hypothetical protein
MSEVDEFEINILLLDSQKQEYTQEDIAMMAMYSCYHEAPSKEKDYSHFVFVL